MGRRIGIAVASAIALGVGGLGMASAADMAVKARPMPVVAFNWTGCYIGVNAGWKAGRFRDESASVPATTRSSLELVISSVLLGLSTYWSSM